VVPASAFCLGHIGYLTFYEAFADFGQPLKANSTVESEICVLPLPSHVCKSFMYTNHKMLHWLELPWHYLNSKQIKKHKTLSIFFNIQEKVCLKRVTSSMMIY
jgi:hypothetical protein